ncbi:MAG: prolipoprotein diacylglyceryl transferase [Bacteroidetes bacterium]|nr:prolipoprotein diacylglyceryl transferase [Bacteroidota bacterium]
MYPRILEIPLPIEFLGSSTITIYSFGAMMAIGFLVAAWLMQRELNRLFIEGRLEPVRIPSKKKSRKQHFVEASPASLVGTVTVIAVVGGIIGAKIFHILENWGDFMADPRGMLFSQGGLTFYGGLLFAAVGIIWYVRKHGVNLPLFADTTLPTVMLAYGIGRIGCHLAGDGDWGIPSNVEAKPGFLPDWLWSETYPNNILGRTLPESGVYPTSIYEFLMAVMLFAVLWSLRKHPFRAGWLASLTVLFFGVERLLIEQIRVNNVFEVLGMEVTQAEIISVIMIALGVAGLVFTTRRKRQ